MSMAPGRSARSAPAGSNECRCPRGRMVQTCAPFSRRPGRAGIPCLRGAAASNRGGVGSAPASRGRPAPSAFVHWPHASDMGGPLTRRTIANPLGGDARRV
jgi:hypothetical protein